MSHTSAPEQKLQLTIRQGRRSIESPETCPLESPIKSHAASSETNLKDGKHGDNCVGSCSFASEGNERSAAEAGTMQIDRTRMESIASTSTPRLPYVNDSNTDPLSHFGFSYVSSLGDERDPSATKIQNWNCHLVRTSHSPMANSDLSVLKMYEKCCKINEIEAENPQTWADVGSDHCTNFECRHPRCSDCYYLNWAWQPIQFCDGRPADQDAYENWYNTFERV